MSEAPVKPPDAATVLGNFQLNYQLADGRTMQVSGYMLSDDTMDSLNKRVEMCHGVVEIHRLRCEILHWEKTKEAAQKQIEDCTAVLKDLQAKQRRREGKLTSQEQQTLTNMPASIAKLYENIPKMEQVMEETRRKIAALASG